MSDLFERGGDITNMDELREAVVRDPTGAAIIIRNAQAKIRGLEEELDCSVRLREKVESVAAEEISRLQGEAKEDAKLAR